MKKVRKVIDWEDLLGVKEREGGSEWKLRENKNERRVCGERETTVI